MSYSKSDFDDFLYSYKETALWSSTDESREDGGDPMDKNYGMSDISPRTSKKMASDCKKFLDRADATLEAAPENIRKSPKYLAAGHDFWLTRNGHGAGFWDGDWPDAVGNKLDKFSKSFGGVDLYVGDDGKIYSSKD